MLRPALLISGWHIDLASRTAERRGQTESLSPRAIRLLKVLASTPGATLSRSELLELVWPDVFISDESLTQVVSELRRKLQDRTIIATVPRGGYRLTAPVIDLNPDAETRPTPRDALSMDAYALCIEAMSHFATLSEGSQRTAVDLAAQAVAIAPNSADARAHHALFLFKRHTLWSEGAHLLEDAFAEVETALALDPEHPLAHFVGGALGLFSGMPRYGQRNLEKALSMMPSSAAIHADASALLLAHGNTRASIALAMRAAQLDRDQYDGEMAVARLLKTSDPMASQVHARRALKKVQDQLSLDPGCLPALYAQGPLLAQIGEVDAARSALEQVAHHNSPLEFFRALGFAQIGDDTSALDRVDFLAMHGWRLGCFLELDEAFTPLMGNRRFAPLRAELNAA